jgi:peptide-methionine (R)-S-oxide reductase
MSDGSEHAETGSLPRTEEEWRKRLTPEQFEVLRNKGTERAFTGTYASSKEPGLYRCAGCHAPLFSSETKFESGTGWPSFWEPVEPDAVELHEDDSLGMRRTEVTCARCGGHLGHLFPDGPRPTGDRYCMNSVALDLEEEQGSTENILEAFE